MTRTLVLASAVAAALLASSCSQTSVPPRSGPPQISIVGGDTIDWGKAKPEVLTRRMVIENTGGDTLDISNVRPSCGCTTAPLSRNKLGPGDTASVDVSIDMKGRHGPQHKTITITSNDSTRENLIVTLMADIEQDMVVEPNFFPVGSDVAVNQEYETAVEVRNTGSDPLTVEPPTALSQQDMKIRFDMQQAKQVPPGSSQRIVAHVTPLKSGTLQNNVVLKTSSHNMPEVQVPLYVTVKEQ